MSVNVQQEQETGGVERTSRKEEEMPKHFVPKSTRDKDLFDNYVDERIQRMFQPFHAIQWLFLMPKYKVCDNLVYFNSPLTDVLSVFTTVVTTALSTYRTTTIVLEPESSTFSEILSITDLVFYSFGFIMSYTLNLYHRKENVELVLNFQKISNMIKFQKNKEFPLFVFSSWVEIAALLAFYIVHCVFSTFAFNLKISDIIELALAVHFELNVIYASRIIVLIENYLNLWNSELKSLMEIVESSRSDDMANESSITCIDDLATNEGAEFEGRQDTMKDEWTRLFELYRKILETYNIYKKAFRIGVLYHRIKTFVFALLYIQETVNTIKKLQQYNMVGLTPAIVTAIWTTKDFVTQSIISFSCQSFYDQIDNAKVICLNAINNVDEEIARRTCKNILLCTKYTFEKMQLGWLCVVDAGMPLIFISNVVNYGTLIVQIALNKKQD